MIQVAVMGYGTVGSGVVEVLKVNKEAIAKRAGEELNVKYVLDLRDFPGDPVQEVITHNFDDIVNDAEVKVVAEVMGGIEPAYTFTKKCLLAGKSVCTSNKALVEKHGAELLAIAKEKNVNYLFEASVGGGIPIIRPLHTSLTADVIEEISGILNGTTNYILSKMTFEGSDFEEVLKDAQAKGYAERNPEADVEGHDAGRKIAILTSLISGKKADFDDIYTEGITKITPADINYAKKLGMAVKLLGTSKKIGDAYHIMVAPKMIGASHPLYSVNDVFNAIFVHGNMLGDAMFYGSGAGKLPTASAVAGDIVEAAMATGNTGHFWSEEKVELADLSTVTHKFFVRTTDSADAVKAVFGNVQILDDVEAGEIGFVTETMSEAQYQEQADKLNGIIGMIRVEG
ncbi:MAG: homoserine dehydrogenase [Lachnospiraceae bacterium]